MTRAPGPNNARDTSLTNAQLESSNHRIELVERADHLWRELAAIDLCEQYARRDVSEVVALFFENTVQVLGQLEADAEEDRPTEVSENLRILLEQVERLDLLYKPKFSLSDDEYQVLKAIENLQKASFMMHSPEIQSQFSESFLLNGADGMRRCAELLRRNDPNAIVQLCYETLDAAQETKRDTHPLGQMKMFDPILQLDEAMNHSYLVRNQLEAARKTMLGMLKKSWEIEELSKETLVRELAASQTLDFAGEIKAARAAKHEATRRVFPEKESFIAYEHNKAVLALRYFAEVGEALRGSNFTKKLEVLFAGPHLQSFVTAMYKLSGSYSLKEVSLIYGGQD